MTTLTLENKLKCFELLLAQNLSNAGWGVISHSLPSSSGCAPVFNNDSSSASSTPLIELSSQSVQSNASSKNSKNSSKGDFFFLKSFLYLFLYDFKVIFLFLSDINRLREALDIRGGKKRKGAEVVRVPSKKSQRDSNAKELRSSKSSGQRVGF